MKRFKKFVVTDSGQLLVGNAGKETPETKGEVFMLPVHGKGLMIRYVIKDSGWTGQASCWIGEELVTVERHLRVGFQHINATSIRELCLDLVRAVERKVNKQQS